MNPIRSLVADLPPELEAFGKSNTVIDFQYNGLDYSVQYTGGQMHIRRKDAAEPPSTMETGDQHDK